MDLSTLKAPKPTQKKAKRVGRGEGSGYGGHTAGKGRDGQRSCSAFKNRLGFEGSHMPLQPIVPKWGFTNHFRKEYVAVNVGTIDLFGEAGKLESSTI